jgi:IS5 family transposase
MKKQSRYVRVARIAYALTRRTLPRYSHPKSPHRYTQRQLAACVLLLFYCNRSYRDFEEWLAATDQVCQVLELQTIPDHSTLSRMFKRMGMALLYALFRRLLNTLCPREAFIAGDSTGYRTSNASAYFQTRTGRHFRDWFTGAYAVGTHSQFIVAACQAHGGSANDVRFFKPLHRRAAPYGVKHWIFLGDAGFDCRAVTDRDLIPPIRRNGRLVAPERQARADLIAQARLDGLYGQRWKAETVHSVIKRLFGDTIRSRSLALQVREPIMKALIYNLHR